MSRTAAPSASAQELTRLMQEWTEVHYTEKFSLDAIAAHMHMDKNYLLRVFRSVTGMTLLQYHNRVRCRHARCLLNHPEISIGLASDLVGFQTTAHFTRIFKQTQGVTPGQYRKQALGRNTEGGN